MFSLNLCITKFKNEELEKAEENIILLKDKIFKHYLLEKTENEIYCKKRLFNDLTPIDEQELKEKLLEVFKIKDNLNIKDKFTAIKENMNNCNFESEKLKGVTEEIINEINQFYNRELLRKLEKKIYLMIKDLDCEKDKKKIIKSFYRISVIKKKLIRVKYYLNKIEFINEKSYQIKKELILFIDKLIEDYEDFIKN